MDDELNRARVERDEGWRVWVDKIPYIQWPRGWEVRAIPAFGGAIIRYNVRRPGMRSPVSIYMDGYERLGFYGGKPYWEVYPVDGDVARCDLKDTKELIALIKKGLKELS